MDFNINIIQNVKKFPQLYQKHSNISERQKIWKLLAKNMKLDEQLLKSRWFILRERYVKHLHMQGEKQQPLEKWHNQYKYAKEMDFMKQHLAVCSVASLKNNENIPRNWNQPEFIITEADIELKPEHELECDELIFMDVVDADEEEQIKEIENTVVIEEEEIPFEQANQDTLPEQLPTETKTETAEDENNTAQEDTTVPVMRQEPKTKVIVEQINIKQEEETKCSNKTPPVDISHRETFREQKDNTLTKNEQERPQQKIAVKNERSEDAIFGELVAAMLKTMEPTRKKTVKKEIMNLLLS